VEQWARDGVPANPKAWRVSTGRFKAIDGMRRRTRQDASLDELAKQLESATAASMRNSRRTNTSMTTGCD
jgi:RNA polymerase sigma-70 factor (ECF subfamily)